MTPTTPLAAQQGQQHLREGLAAYQAGDLERAETLYHACLQWVPDHPEALHLLGLLQTQRQDHAGAALWIERSLRIRHNNPVAWNNLGNVYRSLDRTADALRCYQQALAQRPDYAMAMVNQAGTLAPTRPEGALRCYQAAAAMAGQPLAHAGPELELRMALCDWTGVDSALRHVQSLTEPGHGAVQPFTALAMADDPAWHLRLAQAYARARHPSDKRLGPLPAWPAHPRIRVGYFSADFHNHATAWLMAELFEQHDRTRFEWWAFSFGPTSDDPIRRRLEAAFDHFVDVRGQSDEAVARQARSLEIDIAVDLKGFTQDQRAGIFAQRAAPVQVNYLGYPGSMGMAEMDYLLADPHVLPDELKPACSEQVVRLPHCYQPNDRQRRAAATPTRASQGLPEAGTVFCCFNNNYKITPEVFGLWMDILREVPGSVLWMYLRHAAAQDRLRHEAQQRGVDPQRLVFATTLPHAEHLARYPLADLFLDTLPYNAHTTASDALWMGLPVLTRRGQSFASRVAASLLHAVDLPELVTDSPEAYRALAVALAQQPERLARMRAHLLSQRDRLPLFDTPRLARAIEQAYTRMHLIQRDGQAPQAFDVAG
ncbi:MAG: tetratricopeptide repeat protein [Hydrogenophaga sp.]|nr:tetratricopeptide repeat protein [Hydrogenophaga sp.]